MKILKRLISKVGSKATLLFLGLVVATSACAQSTITNIPGLGGASYAVTALNPLGQAVGFSLTTGGEQHGFLYSAGVSYDLGTLGGSFSLAAGINTNGQIIGDSLTVNDAEFHAFLISGGTRFDLGTLGGAASTAVGINNSGQVAGYSLLQSNTQLHSFLFSGGVLLDLGTLGGSSNSAAALNNLGQVVGASHLINDTELHAYLWSAGVMYDLGTLAGSYSSASSVNDAGQVVGESTTATGDNHAFLFSNGVLNDLGTLGGTYSSAYAINTAGQVMGDSTTLSEAEYHAFLYQNGAMTDLGTLGGKFSSTSALNNRGQVVGQADDANGVDLPFLWQNGSMVDLNSLLPPGSGWILQTASLINDAGQITGLGTYNGTPGSFLLTLATANRAPVANAGPAQTVACRTAVLLDGSASSDPDHDSLTFQWSEGNTVLGTGPTLSVQLPLGSHQISLTVTDPGQLSSQSAVNVNVVDTVAPTLLCLTLKPVAADANCQATVPDVTALVPASDNCAEAASLVRTQDPAAGTPVGVGSNPIVLRVTDPSGNTASCSIVFNVVDSAPPSLVCPAAVTASADANCQAMVPDFAAAASLADNCTPAAQLLKTQTPAAGTLVGLGSYPVTVTVTDAAGNVSSCATSFTVVDKTPPTVSCPTAITVLATTNCQAAVPDLLAHLVTSDNCTPPGQLAKTQNPAAGAILGLGVYPISITVTDLAGNVASCTTTFTVTTPRPLVISCASPATARADQNCQAAVPDFRSKLRISVGCRSADQITTAQNPAPGTLVGPGEHPVTLTVSDIAGNVTSCTTTFTVTDHSAPAITCPAAMSLSADANGQAVVPDLLAGLVVTDTCTPAEQLVKVQDPPAGTVVGLGHYRIKLSVTDASGNSAGCSVTLKVVDSTAPVIHSAVVQPNILTQQNKQLVPIIVTVAATDNSGRAPVAKIIAITSNQPTKGPGDKTAVDWQITGPLTARVRAERAPNGGDRVYTITVRCTDTLGNASTCELTVTVPKT